MERKELKDTLKNSKRTIKLKKQVKTEENSTDSISTDDTTEEATDVEDTSS